MANQSNPITREDIEKWIAALRSGEYKQTQGCLNDSKGFCCLGVYADAIKHVEWEDDPYHGTKGFRVDVREAKYIHTETHMLPEWWMRPDWQSTLSYLNDDEEWTLAQIANFIEREYLNEVP